MTKRLIDVDTSARADGKVPVWDTASGTHVYVASSGSVAADTIWDAAGDLADPQRADPRPDTGLPRRAGEAVSQPHVIRPITVSAEQTGTRRHPASWSAVVAVPEMLAWYCPHEHRSYETALWCGTRKRDRVLRGVAP